MTASRHDKLFGGPGTAEKALASMKKTYGPKKGKTIFDATVFKRERRAKLTKRKGLFR